ncbi:MAG: hypothetical protein JO047_06265 [Alphaproteobacteria bacterium]|nr:hypothetical protein [Alphaproteobacteria bacterium]
METEPFDRLQAKDREELLTEIRQDSEAVARYVEAHGDPVAELQDLFCPSNIADLLCDLTVTPATSGGPGTPSVPGCRFHGHDEFYLS